LERGLERDLDPDAEVPEVVELAPLEEDAVGDDRPGERKHGCTEGAEVVRVAVVTLGGELAASVAGLGRPQEVVDRDARRLQQRAEAVGEGRLAGAVDPVDGDPRHDLNTSAAARWKPPGAPAASNVSAISSISPIQRHPLRAAERSAAASRSWSSGAASRHSCSTPWNAATSRIASSSAAVPFDHAA